MPCDVEDGKLTYRFVWDDSLTGEEVHLAQMALSECRAVWQYHRSDTYPETLLIKGSVFQYDDPDWMPECTSPVQLQKALNVITRLLIEKNPDYQGRLAFSLIVSTDVMMRL